MSTADVLALFKAGPKLTPEQRRAQIGRNAQEYAKQWQEDCYVYMRVAGLVIYSRSKDLDHPKAVPTFISPYHKKERAKKVNL